VLYHSSGHICFNIAIIFKRADAKISVVSRTFSLFETSPLPSDKLKKSLPLALLFLSVPMKNWRPAERIFTKFDTGEFCNVFGQDLISVGTDKDDRYVT
jgi:hypothetical protein